MRDGAAAADALDAVESRRSVRAFLPDPVDRATVERLLAAAARAPSGNNTQPWHVYVLAGAAKERLSAAILAARAAGEEHRAEYLYSLKEWREPYKSRRREVGWALYELAGIGKGDYEASRRFADRNYTFFDAPVGMIVTIDRDMGPGSWLDLGMFLENLMVAARGLGLHSCAQAAFAAYHKVIRAQLPVPEQEMVVCGMALGYEDAEARENHLRTPRAPVAEFARFDGF